MYLDNAATTQIKKSVIDSINQALPYYGNPSSLYAIGQDSKSIIQETKKSIGNLINCKADEVVFTSSGSEADNMAIKGFYFAHMSDCTIITSAIEHKAILNSCAFLERLGANIVFVGVDNVGKIDLQQLEEACKNSSGDLLVSIQYANNEIGVIQDIKTIAQIVHKYNGVFHTDAVQAFPEMKIDVKSLGIDMMSVSGHKFGVPKGIGFLYKREGVEVEPLIHGGQQENGLRAGTENVPYIAGLGKAISTLPSQTSLAELTDKKNYFVNLLSQIPACMVNGSMQDRLANNINVSFKDVEGESLLLLLDMNDICVSSGSACNSGSIEPSYVLKAINVPDDYINGTIRLTINNDITYKDIQHCADVIKDSVQRLRHLAKEGD